MLQCSHWTAEEWVLVRSLQGCYFPYLLCFIPVATRRWFYDFISTMSLIKNTKKLLTITREFWGLWYSKLQGRNWNYYWSKWQHVWHKTLAHQKQTNYLLKTTHCSHQQLVTTGMNGAGSQLWIVTRSCNWGEHSSLIPPKCVWNRDGKCNHRQRC